MARGNTFVYREKKVKRRKGVHAKSKTSSLKIIKKNIEVKEDEKFIIN